MMASLVFIVQSILEMNPVALWLILRHINLEVHSSLQQVPQSLKI